MRTQTPRGAVDPAGPRDTAAPCPDPQAGREAVLDPSSRQDGASASWQTRAACVGQPGHWFFPDIGGPAAVSRYGKARRVCAGCPVQRQCLTEAMRLEGWATVDYRAGMWGGKTPVERVELMRRKS